MDQYPSPFPKARTGLPGRGWISFLPGLLYLVVSLPHLDLVPMWDGLQYTNCLTHSQLGDFFLGCVGHPSQGWLLLPRFSQWLFPGSVYALNISQILLGLLGIGAFQATLRALWPSKSQLSLNLLMASAYAVTPVLVGNLLNFTPDNGVLVFYLCFVAFLLRGRFRLAALSGFFLLFSKEPAIGYYLATLSLFCLGTRIRGKSDPSGRNGLGGAWVLAIPILAFLAVFLGKILFGGTAVWVGLNRVGSLSAGLNPFDQFPVALRLLENVGILNFGWILTALILMTAGYRLGAATKQRRVSLSAVLTDRTVFWLILLPVFLYISTRFTLEHAAPRYVMICLPVLLLAARGSLEFASKSRASILVPLALTLLNIGSLYRSVDPVSRWLFGTFSVGQTDMFKNLPYPIGVNEGLDRDELVYNLQFTKFHKLFNRVLAQKCGGGCQLVTSFNSWSPDGGTSDGGEHRRALPSGSKPALCRSDNLAENSYQWKPPRSGPDTCLIFVAMPNKHYLPGNWTTEMLKEFRYHLGPKDIVEVDGYEANLFRFSPPIDSRPNRLAVIKEKSPQN